MPNLHSHPFHVTDLSAAGETLCSSDYTYGALERVPQGAELIGFFAGRFWQQPDEFETRLPESALHMRWRRTGTESGIATLRDGSGQLLQLSLLLCGEQDDKVHLDILQTHLVTELHDTGVEPAFDLLSQTQRPILVSLCLQSPATDHDKWLFSLADRCLAAAYLRKRDTEQHANTTN